MKTGIHIHVSARIEELADALSADLRKEKAMFDAPVIVVPNRNIRRWLSVRRSAGPDGISAHLRFLHLEEALTLLVQEIAGPVETPPLMDRMGSIIRIYAALSRRADDEVFARMIRPDRPRSVVRQYRLADKLSRIFQEYEYHRAELVDEWWAGRGGYVQDLPDSVRRILDAEKEIFLSAFSPPAKARLPRYASQVLDKPRARPRTKRIRVFGFSQLSRFHMRLLQRLSKHVRIDFYFLDLISGGMDVRPAADWARPYRETFDFLKEAGKKPRRIAAGILRADSLLGELQRALSGQKHKKVHQDRSLQIVQCPSGRREIEVIHDSIITNLASDDSLLLTDIAILVPDIGEYRPWIESVFLSRTGDDGRPLLPFNLTDFSASDESRYTAGLQVLFQLAGREATRLDLFELFRNPCFQAARGVSGADVEQWSSWVAQLGIHRFFDRKHQETFGVAADNLYTWDQGLRRLRLGRIMEPGLAFQNLDPFVDMASGQGGLLSKFSSVLYELGEYFRVLSETADPSEMCRRLTSFVNAFLAVPADRPEEAPVRESVLEGLKRLGREAETAGVTINTEIALQFLLSMASAIHANRGRYLAGGVTIASLQPMRPVPFRIVYLAGMNEESFPGRREATVLNLRTIRPEPGDFALPDLNRMLFLEMILSAREKLYLSYVGRDLIKDRSRAPASTILELREFLNRELLAEREFQIVEMPLSQDSLWFVRRNDPADEVSDLRSTWDPPARSLIIRRHESRAGFPKSVPPGVGRPESERPAAEGKEEGAPAVQVVRLQDLSVFLKNPVEGALARIGVRQERLEDAMEEEDEPFYLPYFVRRRILVDVAAKFLFRPDRLRLTEAEIREWARREVGIEMAATLRASLGPRGGFAEAAGVSLCDEVETTILRLHDEGRDWKVRRAAVGRVAEDTEVIPGGLVLNGRTYALESSPFFLFEAREKRGVLDFHFSRTVSPNRYAMPFLIYTALRCLDDGPGSELPFHVVSESPAMTRSQGTAFQLTRAGAEEYLSGLLEAYTSGAHEFLPISLWEGSLYPGKDGLDPARYADELELALLDRDGSQFPIVTNRAAELSGVSIPENAWDLVMKRWGPVYAGLKRNSGGRKGKSR